MDIRDLPCEKKDSQISWHKPSVDIRDLPCEKEKLTNLVT